MFWMTRCLHSFCPKQIVVVRDTMGGADVGMRQMLALVQELFWIFAYLEKLFTM